MAKYKIMYTDSSFTDYTIEADVLAKIDAEIVMPKSTDEADLISCGKDCDGIIVDYLPITKNVIDKLDKCKIISRQGIGFNNIDLEAASAKGIMVANCPDYCLNEVADHAMALTLACARKVTLFNKAIREGIWDVKHFGPTYSFKDRTFALYGFGNIAKEVAKRAKAFGYKVVSFDPFVPDSVFEEYGVEKIASLEELAEIADVFSIHAPLNKSTEGTVNMSLFKKMKPECILINTSRGPLVNESELIEALEKKMITMAGLDVMENEPSLPGNKLMELENAVLTPHISFYTEESEIVLRKRTAEEIVNTLVDGHPQLKSFVNRKDFGY